MQLDLEVTSWRASVPREEIRADLVKTLRRGGVEVTNDPMSVDGKVRVSWRETRGTMQTSKGALDRRTAIDFEYEVTSARWRAPPIKVVHKAPLFDADLPVDELRSYQRANDRIRSHVAYYKAGDVVAASLGVADAKDLLARELASRSAAQIRDVLRALAYQPPRRELEAYVLVHDGRFQDAAALGRDALPAFEAYIGREMWRGAPQDWMAALDAVARIGGSRAHDVLAKAHWRIGIHIGGFMGQIHGRRPTPRSRQAKALYLPALFQALASVGDPRAIRHVGEYLDDDVPEVRFSAMAAVERLAALLGLQPGSAAVAVFVEYEAHDKAPDVATLLCRTAARSHRISGMIEAGKAVLVHYQRNPANDCAQLRAFVVDGARRMAVGPFGAHTCAPVEEHGREFRQRQDWIHQIELALTDQ